MSKHVRIRGHVSEPKGTGEQNRQENIDVKASRYKDALRKYQFIYYTVSY
jgi:hypothetical protein